jgi:hypothetical protein
MELFWGCAPTIWSVRLIPKAWLFRKRFCLNPKFFFTSTINLKQVYLSRAGRLPVVISVEDTCKQKKQEKDIKLKADQVPKVRDKSAVAQHRQKDSAGSIKTTANT